MSCLALYVLSTDDAKPTWQDRVYGYTGLTGMTQGLAGGYFAWDLWVSLRYIDVLGLGSATHAVAASCITVLGFRPVLNYYGLVFVLYEVCTYLSLPFPPGSMYGR